MHRIGSVTSALAPVIGLASTVVATSFLFFAVSPLTDRVPPQKTLPAYVKSAQGEVLFTGSNSDSRKDVNPSQAIAYADNELGELVALDWQITATDSGETLYSGIGDTVDGVLTQMHEDGKTGRYMLCFSMEDADGSIYELSRRFEIHTD